MMMIANGCGYGCGCNWFCCWFCGYKSDGGRRRRRRRRRVSCGNGKIKEGYRGTDPVGGRFDSIRFDSRSGRAQPPTERCQRPHQRQSRRLHDATFMTRHTYGLTLSSRPPSLGVLHLRSLTFSICEEWTRCFGRGSIFWRSADADLVARWHMQNKIKMGPISSSLPFCFGKPRDSFCVPLLLALQR